jgi:hypothetical protein
MEYDVVEIKGPTPSNETLGHSHYSDPFSRISLILLQILLKRFPSLIFGILSRAIREYYTSLSFAQFKEKGKAN